MVILSILDDSHGKRDVGQIISEYYTYLEAHMDADSVSHMMQCEHLITDDDYEAITTAPNDAKMNCLLLQYVKLMDMEKLLRFCSILKSIETQQHIGNSLEICKLHSCMYTAAHYNVVYIPGILVRYCKFKCVSLKHFTNSSKYLDTTSKITND